MKSIVFILLLLMSVDICANNNSEQELKNENIQFKQIKKANKVEDLTYLIKYIEANPKDISTRIDLAKYYYKTENYEQAYLMAKETLSIDPKQKILNKILHHIKKNNFVAIQEDINHNKEELYKAKLLLREYFNKKNYNEYFNLYLALKDNNVTFGKDENINALFTSIMLQNYKEAQNILASEALPKNKYTLELQMLLANKLSNKVASK